MTHGMFTFTSAYRLFTGGGDGLDEMRVARR
jgi:hypothetical protein